MERNDDFSLIHKMNLVHVTLGTLIQSAPSDRGTAAQQSLIMAMWVAVKELGDSMIEGADV